MRQVEIRIEGYVDAEWSEFFSDLDFSHTDQNETILTGEVSDQAALYGLIAKLRDLGLKLNSINLKDPDQTG